MGSLLLNWGLFAAGLALFILGQLWMSFYGKAYKRHVLHHGRVRFGREYGTSWTRADERGVILARTGWTMGVLGTAAPLLFFFTGLPRIGMPLWLGCTLGIAGIFLLVLANGGNVRLAKREAEIALRHMLEEEERRQDDNSE